jgi:hypothetical protein
MAANDALEVYLNDHLAASAGATDLAGRIRANNHGTALAVHLAGLEQELADDRATLASIMDRLGVPKSTPKQVAGKVMETLSRLRLNERVTRSPDVTRLMEIETLSLGIEGKLALWVALQEVTPSRPELAPFDLPVLKTRAVDQRSGLEPYRLEAATRALGPATTT